ncbi:MAG: PilZ domain-containing protein [Desulfobulbaceae bacterium]|nr:PilZ domain-containing protein [Desulfobulbaceae bacterium]MCK5544291.1 PilZ domain-containing protein [Desulfobulbaceae bacterium]
MVTKKKKRKTAPRKSSGKSPTRKKNTRSARPPVPEVTSTDVEQLGKMSAVPSVKAPKNHEKRRNPRIAFKTSADLKFPDCELDRLVTRDLSTNGTFVLNLNGKQVGDECEVTLHCDLVLKMKGEVIRIDDEGAAIQFFDQDLDNFHNLKNVVYINAIRREEAYLLDNNDTDELPLKKLENIGLLDDIDDEDKLCDNEELDESWDNDY